MKIRFIIEFESGNKKLSCVRIELIFANREEGFLEKGVYRQEEGGRKGTVWRWGEKKEKKVMSHWFLIRLEMSISI